MAIQVLTNCKSWLDGFDLTGDMNAVALTYAAEIQDATTFGQTSRVRKGGLKTVQAQLDGFWDRDGADAPDDVLYGRVGTSNVIASFAPTGGAEGEVAFSFRCVAGEYTPGPITHGEMMAFSVSMEGSDGAPLVQGTVLHNETRTATVTGTAYELGEVAAGETLYAALHVTAVSGTSPSLTVKVQSDDASGFASATDQITFTAATAIGSQWGTAAGAIADTHFRVLGTISGTNPSFTFVVVVGIA